MLTKETAPVVTPRVFTSHGEEIVFSEAIYDIFDHNFAMEKLLEIPDYQFTGETEDEKGEILYYTFDWLEKGNSSKLLAERLSGEDPQFQPFYTEGPGHESYKVLGNLVVYPERLKLTVMGENRFKVGKAVMEKNLKSAIKHRVDSVQTLESKRKEGRRPSDTEGIDPKMRQEILKGLFDKHYINWLDSKIPALGGKTPRGAAKTERGRKELEDLLRVLEYREQIRRETGEPEYDVSWIRRELGMEKG